MTIRKRQNAGRSIRFKWTYVRVREGKGSDLFVFAGSGIRLGVAKNEKRRKQNPCIDFACQSRIRSRGSVFVQRGNGLKSGRFESGDLALSYQEEDFSSFLIRVWIWLSCLSTFRERMKCL